MRVGEKDVIQTLETDAAAQYLPLCPLATVDQEALLASQNRQRRQPAVNRGRGG